MEVDKMINKEQFGKRIALLRKKFGISQAELINKKIKYYKHKSG